MNEERCYQMIQLEMPPENYASWHGITSYSVGILPDHKLLRKESEHYGWAQMVVRHWC